MTTPHFYVWKTTEIRRSLTSSAPRLASSPGFFFKTLNSIFQSINMDLDHKLFLQLIGFCLFCIKIGKT